MPIYEYTCQDCEAHFEKFVRSVNADVEVKCPTCGGVHVKKGWSLFGMAGGNGGFDGLSSAAQSAACSPGGT